MPTPFRRPTAARPVRLGLEPLEVRATPAAPDFDPYAVLPLGPDGLILGTCVADFTGDGKPDVAAGFIHGDAYPFCPALFAVFPGAGDGTFGPPTIYDAGTGSGGGSVETGDFNNDGLPDLAMTAGFTTALGFGDKVSISLNDGAGGFAPPIVFTTGGSDNFVVVADFDEDGNADLALHNADQQQVAVHFGDGTGHFPAATFLPLPGGWGGGQQVVADVNGDGHADIASAAIGANQVVVHFGTGTGAFTAGPVLDIPANPAAGWLGLVAADLDEDGVLDLAAGAGADVFVYRGTGGGGFEPAPAAYPALPVGEAGVMVAADFDGDGHLDVAVGNATSPVIAVLPGDGQGGFSAFQSFAVPLGSGYGDGFRAADLNGDGRPDLVSASHSNPQPGVAVLINRTGDSPPTNQPPVAAGHAYTVAEDGVLAVAADAGLLAGASDPDGDALAVTAVNGSAAVGVPVATAQGTVTVNADGSFTYAPAPMCDATADSFTYTVSDGRGGTAAATVTFTITQYTGVMLAGGVLRVGGTAGNDVVTIASGKLKFNGTLYPLVGVTEVRIWGRAGNDRIDLGGLSLPAFVAGGVGNDDLTGGSGSDTLRGGCGDDELRAVSGNDVLSGGDGNDTLRAGAGCDALDGGAGDDQLYGASGGDVLRGGSGSDVLRAGSGADALFGEDDNDTLLGGSGNDVLDGGEGNDQIDGGSGADTVAGGPGNDYVLGGGGDDYLDGGAGDDQMDGGAGRDILVGAAGNDLLIGGSGNDVLIGGAGADTLLGNAADDILVGGATAWDSTPAALFAIRDVWAGTGTYQTRVAALQSATFAYQLVAGQTVLDDGAADQLTGSSGSDVFFANTTGDGVHDGVTDVGNQEVLWELDPIVVP